MQICDILIGREIIIVNKLDKYTTPPPSPFPIPSRLEHIRGLSRGRKNIFNRDLFWRLTKRSFLPSESEIKEINGSTLEKASCYIQEKEAVVIYPAGGVVDACSVQWKRGVGENNVTIR